MASTSYSALIQAHYESAWKRRARPLSWNKGPIYTLPADFCVLAFPPCSARVAWTYATCCMSQPSDLEAIELHLLCPRSDVSNVELLTVVAHYHRTSAMLGLGHTVNFGRPWLPGSRCDHGLISLPYLDGPVLELLRINGGQTRFLWLIPITRQERDFKRAEGLDALEEAFERNSFDYLDPFRRSVV